MITFILIENGEIYEIPNTEERLIAYAEAFIDDFIDFCFDFLGAISAPTNLEDVRKFLIWQGYYPITNANILLNERYLLS